MTEQEIRAWLLDYAWLGNAEEQAREVACIVAQDSWRALEVRSDYRAEIVAEAGEKPYDQVLADAHGMELSALYECHDGPHLESCPRA